MDAKKIPEEIVKELQDKDEKVAATQQAKGGPGPTHESGTMGFKFFSPTAKLAMGSLAQKSSGAIRCSCNTRFLMSFRRVPVQMANDVPEGRGADSRQGSGRFRGRKVMKFRRVPVQIADKVPEGSGADG